MAALLDHDDASFLVMMSALGHFVRHVVGHRAKKQMRRVDASRSIAFVQNAGAMMCCSCGDWADSQFVGNATGGEAFSGDGERSISVSICGSIPQPAAICFGDFRPKSVWIERLESVGIYLAASCRAIQIRSIFSGSKFLAAVCANLVRLPVSHVTLLGRVVRDALGISLPARLAILSEKGA